MGKKTLLQIIAIIANFTSKIAIFALISNGLIGQHLCIGTNVFNSFYPSFAFHVETNHLMCIGNQMTVFL